MPPAPPARTRRSRWPAVALAALMVLALAASTATATFPGRNGGITFERGGQIWLMNADGTGAAPLVSGRNVSWSPDGTRIAFVRLDGLYVLRIGDTLPVRLADGEADSPAWSPDGRRIQFTIYDGGSRNEHFLWTVNADGSGLHQVTTRPVSIFVSNMEWSPVGNRLAYDAGDEGSFIGFVRPDGGDGGLLPGGSFSIEAFDFSPTWRPDAGVLAYHHFEYAYCSPRCSFPADTALYQIRIADLVGGTRTVLTNGFGPTWSPNERRIAFVRYLGDVPQIHTMRSDGTDVRQITSDPAGASRPRWQPLPSGVVLSAPGQVAVNATFRLSLSLDPPAANLPVTVQARRGAATNRWTTVKSTTVNGSAPRIDLKLSPKGDYRLRVLRTGETVPLDGSASIPIRVG